MRKIGILGGSFDPVHNGHIAIAQDAALKIGLDMIYFMPAAYSPLKTHEPFAPDYCRYRMIELAIKNYPRFGILDWELLQRGLSYTINTVHKLKKNWPHIRFYWIIGGDLVESLPKWKDIFELVKLIDFIAVARPGKTIKPPPIPNLKIHEINNIGLEISSTEIRRKIKENLLIDDLVPIEVNNYILVNKLYHE